MGISVSSSGVQVQAVGFVERISDAELIVLAVMQAFLGFTSEARWLRYAHRHLTPMFPYLPRQSGYNKLNRPGVSGDSEPWEGWSHVREHTQAVSG